MTRSKAALLAIQADHARTYRQVDTATWLATRGRSVGSLFDAEEREIMFSVPDTTPADDLSIPVGALLRRQAGER